MRNRFNLKPMKRKLTMVCVGIYSILQTTLSFIPDILNQNIKGG
jgi:hypothetical protein